VFRRCEIGKLIDSEGFSLFPRERQAVRRDHAELGQMPAQSVHQTRTLAHQPLPVTVQQHSTAACWSAVLTGTKRIAQPRATRLADERSRNGPSEIPTLGPRLRFPPPQLKRE
jgi:hypothetical protein